jgi:hypothetical protein
MAPRLNMSFEHDAVRADDESADGGIVGWRAS